jgi:hypothetical protein
MIMFIPHLINIRFNFLMSYALSFIITPPPQALDGTKSGAILMHILVLE